MVLTVLLVALGLIAGGVIWLAVLAPSALAQTTCPDGPATGTTGEDAVHELRELRRENAQSCAAVRERLSALAERVDAGTTGVQGSIIRSRDLQVGRDSDNPSYVLPAGPTGATGSTGSTGPQEVTLSRATLDHVDSNGNAERTDTWFLVGLLAFAPFGIFFLKIVLP